MYLIMLASSKQFSDPWNGLKNNTLLGTDDLTAAYDVLCWCNNTTPPRQTRASTSAVIFIQHDNTGRNMVPGNNDRLFSDVTCYRYQKMRQQAVNCLSSTSITRVGSQSLHIGMIMEQMTNYAPVNDILNQNWLQLDTCSTISSIKN